MTKQNLTIFADTPLKDIPLVNYLPYITKVPEMKYIVSMKGQIYIIKYVKTN